MNRSIGRLSIATAAAAFVLLLASLFAGFVSREWFAHGLIWSDELARLSFVWCALFGATAAWCDHALHRIDLLVRHLQDNSRRTSLWVCHGLIGMVQVYLIVHGWIMMQRALDQTTSTLQISGAWLYAPLPLAASLMLMVTIGRVLACDDPHGSGEDQPA